jgi:hypothetical protein
MKKVLILFLIPFMMAFQQSETLKDGKYHNVKARDVVYGIEIFNNNTEIKFYLRENEDDESSDWKTFGVGKIVKLKDKYFIENITSKNIPYSTDKKVEMKIKGNIIQFKTFHLLSHLYSSFTQYSDNQQFELKQSN